MGVRRIHGELAGLGVKVVCSPAQRAGRKSARPRTSPCAGR
jgi:hypothetical protein